MTKPCFGEYVSTNNFLNFAIVGSLSVITPLTCQLIPMNYDMKLNIAKILGQIHEYNVNNLRYW
jgi:hypothetical protein